MKNKIVFISFALAFFSSAVFAATPISKRTINDLSARTDALEDQIHSLKNKIDDLQSSAKKPIGKAGIQQVDGQVASLVEMYAHGPSVVTSPVFGLRGTTDAYELMVNLSTINKDLQTLRLRKKMDDYAKEQGIVVPKGPVVVLSGGVEGQAECQSNFKYSKDTKTDINLSRAELDVFGEVGLATAAMLISFDDSDRLSSGQSTARANNSRLRIDRAWLTFGDLNKAPVYFSLGQLYAPFGSYGSFMITSPPTKTLGRTKDRMAVLGYSKGNFYSQLYSLAGETGVSSSEVLMHSGINFGYLIEAAGHIKLHLIAGFLGNLAESQGMQDKIFTEEALEKITSRVHGYALRARVGFKTFDFTGEYITASKAFDLADLTFNGHGARPQAANFEGTYSFKIKDKMNTTFVTYGWSNQAFALGVPKQSFAVGHSIAFVKNTLATIEYRHDINYNWNDYSTSLGGGRAVDTRTKPFSSRHNNRVTIQLGVYF